MRSKKHMYTLLSTYALWKQHHYYTQCCIHRDVQYLWQRRK
jgi:hypothetical protein